MPRSMDRVAKEVISRFEAAYGAKESLGLYSDWVTYEKYMRSEQNPKVKIDDPGSVTNIIFPVIASQVADLVDEPMEIMVTGWEPSDEVFATDVQRMLEWIEFRNRMFFKIDKFAWRWLKFGTSGWKMYYDPNTQMILIEPMSPATAFPDPKVKDVWQIQEGDFFAHAMDIPINYLRRTYGSAAMQIEPQTASSHPTAVMPGETAEDIQQVIANKAQTIECWSKDTNNMLRRVVVANGVKLYDSKRDARLKDQSVYDHGKYPFALVPCYPVDGQLWGMGDVQLLKPVQDLVNDLDDQIRRNARLMGNIQKMIGISSGINPKMWTNKSGINVIGRSVQKGIDWDIIQPPAMPQYIVNRMQEGKQYDAQVISGRPDVVEGRRTNVRAASGIIALQEAGIRRARHKKLMLQESLSIVFDMCVDYMKQFYTEKQAFRILGKNKDEQGGYVWFRGSDLKSIKRMTPELNMETNTYDLKPLLGNDGKELTKDAKFDIRVNIGAGLPHNKAFLYQSLLEFVASGLLTQQEGRRFMKDMLDWPVANPDMTEGLPAINVQNMNLSGSPVPRQGPGANEEALQTPEQVPPEIMMQLAALLGGGGNVA